MDITLFDIPWEELQHRLFISSNRVKSRKLIPPMIYLTHSNMEPMFGVS